MKTLHSALRVAAIERALSFYQRVGFGEIGRVTSPDGALLVMLNLPGDGDVVTLELVYRPAAGPLVLGDGFSHLAVQVDDLDAALASLAAKGIEYDAPQSPGGPDGPKTSFLHDPDGHAIELVEWPSGHPDRLTRADFT